MIKQGQPKIDKTAKDPFGVSIYFNESEHIYWTAYPVKGDDDLIVRYISGTAFIHKFEKPFESDKMAEKSAAKRGTTKEAMLAEWAYTAECASRTGTRMHANNEDILNGKQPRFQPCDNRERLLFTQAWMAAKYMKSNFKILGAEIIVFSTDIEVSGTIDFLMMDAQGTIYIMDWKQNKQIRNKNDYGEKMLSPVEFLDSCEQVKYELQLSLYEFILRSRRYISPTQRVVRALVHVTTDGWTVIPCEDRSREIAEMLVKHLTVVPF